MILPKLIITDIDGVWTDAGMYYDNFDNEFKKFNTKDSAGILYARYLNIPVAIISGEDTEIVKRRAKKLNIKYVFLGIKNKVEIAENLCTELNITFKEIAFIGDDINDINLHKKVGLSACPKDSPSYVKSYTDWTLNKKGGKGVFREFVEKIIKKSGLSIKNIVEEIIQEN